MRIRVEGFRAWEGGAYLMLGVVGVFNESMKGLHV